MKNIISASFVLAFALVLTGCKTAPVVEREVIKTKYIMVTPEGKYLKMTPVPLPPVRKSYEPTEVPDFESLYAEQTLSVVELYKTIGQCNADKKALTLDIDKKRKAYE